MNQEDKSSNKYLPNNTKSVIWGFYRITVEEAVFQVFTPCGWIICSPSFEEIYGLYFSLTWRRKRYDASKRRDTITQTRDATTQWPTSSIRKQLETNIFPCCVIQWVKRQPGRYTSRILRRSILSLSLVRQAARRIAVVIVTCNKYFSPVAFSKWPTRDLYYTKN
jgi:hypothetical protein